MKMILRERANEKIDNHVLILSSWGMEEDMASRRDQYYRTSAVQRHNERLEEDFNRDVYDLLGSRRCPS